MIVVVVCAPDTLVLVDKDMLRILVPLAADVAANIYPNATPARPSSKLLALLTTHFMIFLFCIPYYVFDLLLLARF